jgi:hypothetical protein
MNRLFHWFNRRREKAQLFILKGRETGIFWKSAIFSQLLKHSTHPGVCTQHLFIQTPKLEKSIIEKLQRLIGAIYCDRSSEILENHFRARDMA